MSETLIGTGQSSADDSTQAIQEALMRARQPLKGTPPRFGLIFAGPKRPLDAMLTEARQICPGADILGCTTAGEFTEEGLLHDGVVCLLACGEGWVQEAAFATNLKLDPEGAAAELCAGFSALRRQAADKKFNRPTTILLSDGLAGTGEDALQALTEETSSFQQFVGGAAGDEGAFAETQVGVNEGIGRDALAALHVFSDKPWGVGTGHGLAPASERMRATRSEGNVLYEIDGRPAFDVYKEHAASRGQELTPETAGSYMIHHEIGLYFFDRIKKARAPLAVNPDGSLNLAASVNQGATICILDGERDAMVAAARDAAVEARKNLGDAEPAGVVVFDCVCRGMILAEDFQREIDAVREVFDNVPVAGFLTYGEIARYKGHFENWHNTTAVVVAIPK